MKDLIIGASDTEVVRGSTGRRHRSQFAKTGNPGQPGLEWRPYTPDNPQALVFDTVSQCYPLHDDKLASLLPAVGGRGGRGGRGGPLSHDLPCMIA